jgi:hypothetical protein
LFFEKKTFQFLKSKFSPQRIRDISRDASGQRKEDVSQTFMGMKALKQDVIVGVRFFVEYIRYECFINIQGKANIQKRQSREFPFSIVKWIFGSRSFMSVNRSLGHPKEQRHLMKTLSK